MIPAAFRSYVNYQGTLAAAKAVGVLSWDLQSLVGFPKVKWGQSVGADPCFIPKLNGVFHWDPSVGTVRGVLPWGLGPAFQHLCRSPWRAGPPPHGTRRSRRTGLFFGCLEGKIK